MKMSILRVECPIVQICSGDVLDMAEVERQTL